MFKSLAIILAVALVASANQDYKSNRMKLLTQTVSARLHGEALPSDQPQFKAVSRTKNLQASIPQGSQLQFQSQPQFVSQQFGTQMPMSQLSQQQQFVPQFQAPSSLQQPQQQQQQRAPSAMEQAQLQQQLQKQQQIQQQQQQINAQKAVQDQQVLQQQQQLIQQQQQQQHISAAQQPQQQVVSQQVVSQQMPQQQAQQFIVSPDASSISGAQAPISPLQQQQLMQQQQQQQMINSQQQSQIPQLQQQQSAQLQQQQIQQQQRVPQPIAPISQQFTAPQQQVQQFTAPAPQQVQQFTAPAPQQVQQFAPQQQFVAQQAPQFVQQQQPTFQQQQQQFPVSSSGLAQTCSTAQPGDLIAHPASPSSFIICYGFGEFTVMECPEHLVFNAHTQRCDLTTDVPMGCASNPCVNNGQCADIAPGVFQCKCPIGFNGPHCERVDACSANTCGGDGVCIALPAGSPVPNACMCNGGRSIGVNCASAEANPCIQPNSNLRLFSVNFNPSLFAHCEGARPNFMFCQAPLIFNAAKQSCDWPSRK